MQTGMYEHLKEKNISYWNHLKQAWYISYRMIIGGVAGFIHGVYPGVFNTTATDAAREVVGYAKKAE